MHKRPFRELDTNVYQEPSLRPHRQIRPSVAVFCSFFRRAGAEVRKTGRLEKSRRHSLRASKPSASLYSYVSVVSFSAWVVPLNSPPRSDMYSLRAATALRGDIW